MTVGAELMNTFQRIAAALSAYQPSIRSETDKTQAAVAAVFHPRRDDLYLLFIERATHPTDPWSGHIAFPGGTAEPDDPDLKYTAERETREELGLDLSNAQYLGRLDDVTGATLPIQVACFVYAIFEGVEVAPNDEVRDVFWTPFAHFADSTRWQRLNLEGWHNMPAIDLLGANRPVLWGLTYRMVAQMAGFAGVDLPERL